MGDITKLVEGIKDELVKKTSEATEQITAMGRVNEATQKAITDLSKKLEEVQIEMKRPGPMTKTTERKSVGQQFTESKAFTDMMARGSYESDRFEYKDIVASQLIDAVNGMPVLPMVIPGVVMAPEVDLRIADLLPKVGTDSNSIAYVRGTFTSAAATVKESKEGTIQNKPESALAFEPEVEPVQTIAHWIPATRQILADAPALRGLIDNNLLYELKLVEEQQILFGNGTAPNLNGICPQATPYDDTLPTQLGVTNITRIDHIRAAILQARQARYPVSGLVLNPFDFAAIELAKDTIGKYIWVTVPEGGAARLWRVPVVESDNMTEGHFLVGAFRLGATLYTRETASIRVSEHHASFFTQNLVAILCEERLALVVTRPQAFIYGDFEEGS